MPPGLEAALSSASELPSAQQVEDAPPGLVVPLLTALQLKRADLEAGGALTSTDRFRRRIVKVRSSGGAYVLGELTDVQPGGKLLLRGPKVPAEVDQAYVSNEPFNMSEINAAITAYKGGAFMPLRTADAVAFVRYLFAEDAIFRPGARPPPLNTAAPAAPAVAAPARRRRSWRGRRGQAREPAQL